MELSQLEMGLVQRHFAKKGYEFFEQGDYNLNIVGVRTVSKEAGAFDDFLAVFYRENGVWKGRAWVITTDPGTYWLEHPENVNGTAVVMPGQYKGLWKKGLHKGQYLALVQAKPIRVYRDANHDEEINCDPSTIDTGIFGINCHHASGTGVSRLNDKWSAGCQVFADIADWNEFMSIVDKAAEIWGPTFSYTLLEESEIN
jgi:hypothetical protein